MRSITKDAIGGYKIVNTISIISTMTEECMNFIIILINACKEVLKV